MNSSVSAPIVRNGLRLVCSVLLLVLAVRFAGCAPEKPRLEIRSLTIRLSDGGEAVVEAEIAKTAEQRSAGLMYRKELAEGRGMLFVFENDAVQSFWMKNTLIPLSIAFILYDGTIAEIKNMYPGDLSPVHSSRSVRYALEVPQGWFTRAGIRAGDRLDLGGFLP